MLKSSEKPVKCECFLFILMPQTHYHRPMICRSRCAACCIAPSISSAIPGMPQGKAAGERCLQLDEQDRCRLFGRPERPLVCQSLMPTPQMCGEHREHAMQWLTQLESDTAPR
jgi:uncharacterized protein